MESQSFVISLLQTSESTVPFYQKLGWYPIREESITVRFRGEPTTPTVTPSLHSLVIDGIHFENKNYTQLDSHHQETLRKFYALTSSQYDGPLIRNHDYWSRWISSFSSDGCTENYCVFDNNKEFIGYISLGISSRPLLSIKELLVVDKERMKVLENILHELIIRSTTYELEFPSQLKLDFEGDVSNFMVDKKVTRDVWMCRTLSGTDKSNTEGEVPNFLFWKRDCF
eukprot:TRINITY_DN15939_c0_g1_i1.p1 TRINITY_DN15939_c0_g1~~TRINITY_DN15939_c0_g1_i1.p1  ORF type:complete len:227 (+),score=19.35 TRINITY_DN15939_c0_g1_i1:481-1161(+)